MGRANIQKKSLKFLRVANSHFWNKEDDIGFSRKNTKTSHTFVKPLIEHLN